jgi:hypothetical protein
MNSLSEPQQSAVDYSNLGLVHQDKNVGLKRTFVALLTHLPKGVSNAANGEIVGTRGGACWSSRRGDGRSKKRAERRHERTAAGGGHATRVYHQTPQGQAHCLLASRRVGRWVEMLPAPCGYRWHLATAKFRRPKPGN